MTGERISLARIIEYIPDPSVIEICSYCREKIKLVTKYEVDGEPYPACANCGDCIDNPWTEWTPEANDRTPSQSNEDQK